MEAIQDFFLVLRLLLDFEPPGDLTLAEYGSSVYS